MSYVINVQTLSNEFF